MVLRAPALQPEVLLWPLHRKRGREDVRPAKHRSRRGRAQTYRARVMRSFLILNAPWQGLGMGPVGHSLEPTNGLSGRAVTSLTRSLCPTHRSRATRCAKPGLPLWYPSARVASPPRRDSQLIAPTPTAPLTGSPISRRAWDYRSSMAFSASSRSRLAASASSARCLASRSCRARSSGRYCVLNWWLEPSVLDWTCPTLRPIASGAQANAIPFRWGSRTRRSPAYWSRTSCHQVRPCRSQAKAQRPLPRTARTPRPSRVEGPSHQARASRV